jgi:hypothetical protein
MIDDQLLIDMPSYDRQRVYDIQNDYCNDIINQLIYIMIIHLLQDQ